MGDNRNDWGWLGREAAEERKELREATTTDSDDD